ncbi:cupin domain-containing protein [Terrarubrum flagellatum]|uniref:cupin domain-containing protein n=1 Tax=Terrirubrum flagellatum TaxID=2895980 RepID=UPI003145559A
MAKKIDVATLVANVGTFYPPPYDEPCVSRERTKLGDPAGLTQFGVNLLRLPPGAWSSQRHWQTESDEFVYVLSGEVTLVTDDGEEILRPGDAAGFKAGDPNGHCLQNRTQFDAFCIEVGTRIPGDGAIYPDIDMISPAQGKPAMYVKRDGTPYPDIKRRSKKVDPAPLK